MNKNATGVGVVDRIAVRNEGIFLTGWAFDRLTGGPLKYRVLLDGVEIEPLRVDSIYRADVCEHLAIDGSIHCGFRIACSIPESKSDGRIDVIVKGKDPSGDFLLNMGSGVNPELADLKLAQNADASDGSPVVKVKVSTQSGTVSCPNILAVFGEPNSGKTHFSHWLSGLDGIYWIHTDLILNSLVSEVNESSRFWVESQACDAHYNLHQFVNSELFSVEAFSSALAHEINKMLEECVTVHTIVVEGYVMREYERIFRLIGVPEERLHACVASADCDGKYYIDGFDVTGGDYQETVASVKQVFRDKCWKLTIPKSTYQDLSTVFQEGVSGPVEAVAKTDSRTQEKFVCSGLQEVVDSESFFLDVGCNAGYFCFALARRKKLEAVGVDMSLQWLKIGSHVSSSFESLRGVSFLHMDAFEFFQRNKQRFDVIHCASTYHYFRDRQREFLQSTHDALVPGGLCVLEVEIANEDDAEAHLFYRSRGVDSSPCAFPNKKAFIEQIAGLFCIENESESVFQAGSFYERTYFHLRAI